MSNVLVSKPEREPLDFCGWLVLNALSDDYESVEQVVRIVIDDWPEVTPLKVIDCLEFFHAEGLVLLNLNARFDRGMIVREIEQSDQREFWFGRTPSGDALWRQHAAEFGYD